MSECISRQGEFSSHEFDGPLTWGRECNRCFAFVVAEENPRMLDNYKIVYLDGSVDHAKAVAMEPHHEHSSFLYFRHANGQLELIANLHDVRTISREASDELQG